jgi:hypothetical protein
MYDFYLTLTLILPLKPYCGMTECPMDSILELNEDMRGVAGYWI